MPMEERMVERRWERRLLCADLVQIEWEDQAGVKQNATAILEDISHSGACLQADVPLPVESLVRVKHGKKTLKGQVSYCAYREIGYFMGVRFVENGKWTPRMFRPKHLVDPSELEGKPDKADVQAE
jgi:hypothetical protein